MTKIYHVLIQMFLWTPSKAVGSISIIKRTNLEIGSPSMHHYSHQRAGVCHLYMYKNFAVMEAPSSAQQSYYPSSTDTDDKSSVPVHQVTACLRSKYVKESLDLQHVLSIYI